jgi:hypothetical protein
MIEDAEANQTPLRWAGAMQPNRSLVRINGEMSPTELRALLDQVADTRELVLRRAASLGPAFNAVYDAWSDAHEEAEHAYVGWRATGDGEAYAVYRAAQDREDAAQDALAGAY